MKKILVSFVIRTKDEELDIRKVLEAIKRQKFKDKYEIILVDSESTDKTVKIAEKYTNKIVYINQEDFTWGKALNRGIEVSEGK